ncbi:MAG: VanZ family protein [Verrucomicrobiales bacterium]
MVAAMIDRLLAHPFARRAAFWWWLYLGWFVLLFILSSMRPPPLPSDGLIQWDKLLHATYFAGGSTGVGLALRFAKRRIALPIIALSCVLLAAAVGWFDEWHQTMTPGRYGLDVYDWIADCIGGVLGIPISAWIAKRIGEQGESS